MSRGPSILRFGYLAAALLAAGCGNEPKEAAAPPPSAAPTQREAPASPAASPAVKPLPARGQAMLHYAAGLLDVDAYAAPRRPLLEQLAREAGFALEADTGDWPPLTLRLEAAPLELALPKLVGDLEYAADWKTVNGAHRLAKLKVGAVRPPSSIADAQNEDALQPGEVSAALDRALAEMRSARSGDAGATARTSDAPRIDDRDPEARMRAVLALEPEGEQLATLENILKNDPDPRVRAAATASLENSEDFAAIRSLVDALHDQDPEVVVEVIDSLEFAADASIVPDLEPLLAHDDARVRQRAADAIEFFGR